MSAPLDDFVNGCFVHIIGNVSAKGFLPRLDVTSSSWVACGIVPLLLHAHITTD